MYPLHKSDTGSFQELVHKSDVEFGQLSLLTIAPGCTRGGHYHTRKKEWFCCLHGRCVIVTTDVTIKDQQYISLSEDNIKFVAVNPRKSHTVVNTGSYKCELLVICDEEYDANNTDTIRYEEET